MRSLAEASRDRGRRCPVGAQTAPAKPHSQRPAPAFAARHFE
jgi:hypothetical protein